jgi:hypothetical protein
MNHCLKTFPLIGTRFQASYQTRGLTNKFLQLFFLSDFWTQGTSAQNLHPILDNVLAKLNAVSPMD